MFCAPTESRTRTPSRVLEPKSSVSANSTISARKVDFLLYAIIYHTSYQPSRGSTFKSLHIDQSTQLKKPVILISTYIATAKGGINHV